MCVCVCDESNNKLVQVEALFAQRHKLFAEVRGEVNPPPHIHILKNASASSLGCMSITFYHSAITVVCVLASW